MCESGPRLLAHHVGSGMENAAIAARAFGAALNGRDCSIEVPHPSSVEWQEQKFGIEKACRFWLEQGLSLTEEAVSLMQRYGITATIN